MSRRIWYHIYARSRIDGTMIEVARVKSQGLAIIVRDALAEHYEEVEIR